MMKTKPFSILNRAEDLKTVSTQKFDLVIIGGGVTGAGIALDAASRGLKTCLIEKNDFASGTSNKSTKLIHGGLRYLKQLEIGLVRESGRERAIVHTLAPHLVIPEKMLLPLVEDGTYGKMMTSIGLKVYDFLADVEGDDRRRMLDKAETLKKEPLLDEETILGSGYYSEYRTDDARLTIELLKKASEFGATILNYCEMDSFVYNSKKEIKSIDCIDHNSGESINIRSINFVSATGPWVDKLREKDASKNKKHLHLTKGVHIVFPIEKFPLQQSVYFDVADGRMIFAIPRGRATYVGTTDTDYFGNLDRVVTTKADIHYLLDAVNAAFPDIHLKEKDIESNWAGLRPLIHEEEKDPSELSRKDEIFISKSGLISIAGGKLTGYRKMAQRVMDAVLNTMTDKQVAKLKDSYTEKILLTTDAMTSSKEVKKYRKKLQLKLQKIGIENDYFAWYLTSNYGKQTNDILEQMQSFLDKDPEARLIRAELWYGIHHEMINSLADFFVRRTGRLYFNISSIAKFESLILKDCTQYLHWDASRIKKEKETLSILVKDATHFYDAELV
ncbi:FAD-dependent oxidoreductase [Lacinutrix sp. MEBiC02595]